MPNRIIRESLLDSARYAGLTNEAKLLFFHMLLLADDFGCIGVSETFLRRRAFYDMPTGQKIAKLLNELVDVDLVRTYEAQQAVYAFIPRFRQRLQRNTLRHPKPPESLIIGDEQAIEKFNEIKEIIKIPTVGNPLANRFPTAEVKRREVKTSPKVAKSDLGLKLRRSVWDSYSEAYFGRYHAEATDNAPARAAIKRFCSLVPESDAAHIANFFVLHNNSFYVSKGHNPTLLAADAAKLRTEWITGTQITQTSAQQADKRQTNKGVFQKLIDEATHEQSKP